MIANFFSKTKPIHALCICGLFVFYFLAALFFVLKPEFSFQLILKSIGLLLVYLVLFFVVRFINRKNYLSGQNSYVLLILAFLFGMFPFTMEWSYSFIAHFILLLGFRRIYSIRTLKSVKQKLFDSGMWIGVAMLFNVWSVVFIGLIYAAIFVYKRQSIRNHIIPVVGLLTPLFLAFTVHYVLDTLPNFYDKLVFAYSFDFGSYASSQLMLPIFMVSSFVVIGILAVSVAINSMSIEFKQSWALIVAHFFCAVYLIVFSPVKDGSEFLFMFFPSAIIIANLLQLIPYKNLREILVYAMLIVSIYVYIL